MNKKITTIVVAALVIGMYAAAELDRGIGSVQGTLIAANPGQGNQGGGTGGGQGNQGGGTAGQGNQGGGTGGGQGNQGGGNGGQGNQGGGNGGGQGNQGGGNGGGQGNQGGGNGGQGNQGDGNGGGGGDNVTLQGRGLRQHAAVFDYMLKWRGIHTNPLRTYEFFHPKVGKKTKHASAKEERAWATQLHGITCGMFRYMWRLRENHPTTRTDYVDWIVDRVADALGEDATEIKAAILGLPHQHQHGAILRRIGEIGCATDAPSVSELEAVAESHTLHEHENEESKRFTILDQSTSKEIAFQVIDSGSPFRDFGVSHEKKMHVIIVRDDLRHFAHIHPERDAEGTWRVPYAAPAGGAYRIYADFVDSAVHHHTVRFDRAYEGETGNAGFQPSFAKQKRVGKYAVLLEEKQYSNGTLFTFHIDDADGNAPYLEPYLGQAGHSILLSVNGGFIHTHPSPVSDHLTFQIGEAPDKFYRIFTQFQVDGEVLTVDFDWQP